MCLRVKIWSRVPHEADSPTRVAFASLAPILSLISLLCPYHSTYKYQCERTWPCFSSLLAAFSVCVFTTRTTCRHMIFINKKTGMDADLADQCAELYAVQCFLDQSTRSRAARAWSALCSIPRMKEQHFRAFVYYVKRESPSLVSKLNAIVLQDLNIFILV